MPGAYVRLLLIAQVVTGQPRAWRSGGTCPSQWPRERVFQADTLGGCLRAVVIRGVVVKSEVGKL